MCARMCMCSVMSSCVQPRGLWHTSLLCPQDSPGKNTGRGCRFLFLLCEPHLSVKLSVCRGSAWQNAFCVFWEQEVTIVGPSFFPLVLNREMQFLGHHPLQTLLYQEGSVSGSWVQWVLCILWGGKGISWWCDLPYQFLLMSLVRSEG